MAARTRPHADAGNASSPEDRARAAYEQAESAAAKALEELVAKPSVGWVFARSAENVAALVRMSADAFDLVLRNLRVAGRADISRLARQLHRTEDKLERVLQEVEAVRDELERRSEGSSANRAEPTRIGRDDVGDER